MTNLLIAPARQSGCQDLEAFANVVQAAAEQQRSPIDDILDSGVVEEELYLSALAQQSRMEWVTSIADFENIGVFKIHQFIGKRKKAIHHKCKIEQTPISDELIRFFDAYYSKYELGPLITKGKLANVFITTEIPSLAFLPYAFGSSLVETCILKGKVVATAG